MKKFLAITLLLTFVFSFAACAVNEEAQRKERIDTMIENMENEIDAMRMDILSSDKSEAEQKKLIEQKTLEIQKKYGFIPVEGSKSSSDEIIPFTSSTAIYFPEETISYNSSERLYYYSCNWDFTQWDSMCDIEDFVAVRMTNPDDYYVYSTFAKTFDEFGRQTGYVDNTGNHTPSYSCVTKRSESDAGVIFNVIDNYQVTQDSYLTDQGRVTMCFAKKSSAIGTPVNKVITDFNHNFKVNALSHIIDASISGIGLDGVDFELNVTYASSNGVWQRSSGGKIIGS